MIEAEAVAKAVIPDNIKVPDGLYIKTTRQDKVVLTEIKCQKKILTFMATIDDLLNSVTIAEKTFLAVKTFEKKSR
jgi:hypothetical protein